MFLIVSVNNNKWRTNNVVVLKYVDSAGHFIIIV